MGEIGRAVDVTIRAVADYHAEASATPDLKEVSGRKVEFDYLRVYVFITCAHPEMANLPDIGVARKI
jgi:hypothetical protein